MCYMNGNLLTGVLSSKYANRIASNSLNETLHMWMSCRATRTLIDLNTQCLTCLMHSNTDACINALLGEFQFYFQWLKVSNFDVKAFDVIELIYFNKLCFVHF